MHTNKSELEALESIDRNIFVIRKAVDNLKQNCNSIIVGHDMKCDLSQIENYLQAASQKTSSLKLAFLESKN